MRLRVCAPEGKVKISVPRHVPIESVEQFVLKNIAWIRQQQDRIKARPAVAAHTPRFVEREPYFHWGKQYLISVKAATGKPSVALQNGWLLLHAPAHYTDNELGILLDRWEKDILLAALPDLITLWEPVMGVRVERFSVRPMKTRWGSCNITRRSISLNQELVRRPFESLEYVLVHEMVHLLERGHNARFYQFMSHFLPDWRERENRLSRKPLR